MEAGNILNHGVYNNPNGDFTSATFGQITGVRGEVPGASDPLRLARDLLDATPIG